MPAGRRRGTSRLPSVRRSATVRIGIACANRLDQRCRAAGNALARETSRGPTLKTHPNPHRIRWLAVCAALPLPGLFAAPAGGSSGAPAAAAVWQRYVARSHEVLSSLNHDRAALAAPPAGVTELSFAEFFGPIGDRGLEYSAKLRALDGQPVRLVGYMIRETERAPGLFRLTAWPLAVAASAPCSVDQAPPSAVHVHLPTGAARFMPYRPGRLVLTGRLEIGPRVERDGRNSAVRLMIDEAAAARLMTGAAEP